MPGPQHPDVGARFVFRRTEAIVAVATYEVTLFLPAGATRRSQLTLSRELGTAEFDGLDDWTDWELKTVRALARSLLKSGPWPRRLTRWKTEG